MKDRFADNGGGRVDKVYEQYDRLNVTIRCLMFEQYRAFLRCPLCRYYSGCEQLTEDQRGALEGSPFFVLKAKGWIRVKPKRREKKIMKHIAVCVGGGLRLLDDFDPKDNSGNDVNSAEMLEDVEEVLVVTKAYRRKMVWEIVSVTDVAAVAAMSEVKKPEVEDDL